MLEIGYSQERKVEAEIMDLMNIKSDIQDNEALDTEIDIQFLLQNDDYLDPSVLQYDPQSVISEDENIIPNFFLNHINYLKSHKKQFMGSNNANPNELNALQS